MRKIPTLFVRDPENRKLVLSDVTPGCEWVLAGEGVPTRKYDGTCVLFDGERWWARRQVNPGGRVPAEFVVVESDLLTGKTVGWIPMGDSTFARWHDEALQAAGPLPGYWVRGTYELCGPRINRNPERFDTHTLVSHDSAQIVVGDLSSHDQIRTVATTCGYEGIVWHHQGDERMAKIKARDFGDGAA